MTLRPRAARWFEVIAARDDAYLALEALATAGCVEIEWHSSESGAPPGSAAARLKTYGELARRYGRYWPPAAMRLGADARAPADALEAGIDALSAWARDAEPLIAELQQDESTRTDLVLADQALMALADSSIDFSLLAQSQAERQRAVGVAPALFALPVDATVPIPDEVLTRQATVGNETLLLAVGPPAAIDAIARGVAEVNGRRARFPDWLQPSAQASRAQIAQKHEELGRRADTLRLQLARLADVHQVARALGDVARATWCFEHGGAISLGSRDDPDHGDVFARLTGWATDAERLIAAVEASPARALVSFPPPPRGARPPLVLANPWWARPFELFPKLVGMPGASGADPSVLLAFAVPLMFGYMFGDIGQGLVLAGVGLLLSKRLPVLRLLVPGGLAAACFGWVFGSVFSIEHLIDPLWLHPLVHPLPVLIVPVVAGAVFLTLGLLLGLLQSWWQQDTAHWLRSELPVLMVYLGVLTGIVSPVGWALAVAGALLAMLLAALHAREQRATLAATTSALALAPHRPASRGPLAAALGALGELVEHTLQLLINTLSFARVGAFALAHAGLSSAVVALAAAAGHPVAYAVVLVLGNVLIMAIEGLVVSIQTTRLVLFEFFTRFFKAEGREFRPLIPPPPQLASGELVLTKER